ncbi:hypothetical protein MKEN_01236100 [Mycena kentingensis (nom. inval.)]|nr:hypothetical protein MKEN_01236100 [Mycena kentingensis (nom. inval.)]
MSPASESRVKHELQGILRGGLERPHPLVHATQYPLATVPDPQLAVWTLGGIPLPLHEGDAQNLIASAPLLGSSNYDSSQSSGVWEIPGDKLFFYNPAWHDWVRNVVGPAALRGIGVPEDEVHKLCVPSCLRIQESAKDGARMIIAEAPKKLAELAIFVHSTFTGCPHSFQHKDETFHPIPISPPSSSSTSSPRPQPQTEISVVCAYTGIEQIIPPLARGFRVSVVYDVVHDGKYVLPPTDSPRQCILRALGTWAAGAPAPSPPAPVLALLLAKDYPDLGSHVSALASVPPSPTNDQRMFAILENAARMLDLALYLANVEINVVQQHPHNADNPATAARAKSNSKPRPGPAMFWDNEIAAVRVGEVWDLHGCPVEAEGIGALCRDQVVIKGKTEFVSAVTVDVVEDAASGGKRISSTYHHSAFLLWPQATQEIRIIAGQNTYDHAFPILQNCTSPSASRAEHNAFDALARWCKENRNAGADAEQHKEATRVLQECSARWHDPALFLCAMSACGADEKIEVLGVAGFVEAYRVFGWDAIRDLCTAVVTNEAACTLRWELTMRLWELAVQWGDAELSCWCSSQHQYLGILVGECVERDVDLDWLVEVVIAGGGELLKEVIYPQLASKRLAIDTFWIRFLRRLHENRNRISFVTDPKALYDTIKLALEHIVARLAPFCDNSTSGDKLTVASAVDTIFDVLRCAIEIGHGKVCEVAAARMRSEAFKFESTHDRQYYYESLVRLLVQYFPFPAEEEEAQRQQATMTPNYWLQKLYHDAVVVLMSPYGPGYSPPPAAADESLVPPFKITEESLEAIMLATRRLGGPGFLTDFFLKHEITLRGIHPDSLCALAEILRGEFRRDELDSAAYRRVIMHVTSAALDATNVSLQSSLDAKKITSSVEFCFAMGAPNVVHEKFLLRVAEGLAALQPNQRLSQLIPVLSELYTALKRHGLDLQHPAFRGFAASIARMFTQLVASAFKEPSAGCGKTECRPCSQLDAFLDSDGSGDAPCVLAFKMKLDARKHVEQQLRVTGLSGFGIGWETVRDTVPHTLKITKTENFCKFRVSPSRQCATLLALLGSRDEQRVILGEEFEYILWTLKEVQVTSAESPSSRLLPVWIVR